MKKSPSQCWFENCYAGASFLRPSECKVRHEIGVDRIMWGQDYPHGEGTWPYTTEALQNTFAGMPADEVASMVGGTAAAVYGFDLTVLGQVAARSVPRLTTSLAPRGVPADTLSMAFAGEKVKPW